MHARLHACVLAHTVPGCVSRASCVSAIAAFGDSRTMNLAQGNGNERGRAAKLAADR